MKLRKLRIAFSAFCAIACVLLIVLWVRSFNTQKRQDIISVGITGAQSLAVLSEWGKVSLGAYNTQGYIQGAFELFHASDGSWNGGGTYGRFYFGTTSNSAKLIVPHYFVALLFGITAMVTGVRRPFHFSLRGLLIATTTASVVLAFAVWAVRI